MKIILPMAGNGSRFFEAGYDKLKPLIDIKGKPMFVRVLDNILYGTDIHIIIRKDHVDEYKLDQLIREACPEAKIYVLDKSTEGAACTVMHAIDQNKTDGFLVANCDQLMVWEKQKFIADIFANPLSDEGTIFTFTPNHNKPIHSYVTTDDHGYVTELAEKKMISNIATVGVYHFGSQKKFAEGVKMMMEENDRTNGEFYLAPVYNYLIDPIKTFHVKKFIGLGTPEELEDLKQSEWWNKLDKI